MQKFLKNKLVLLIVTILVVVFSISLRKTRLKTEYSGLVLKRKEAGLDQLKQEVGQLKKKQSKLTDEFYQEKIIRDELLMQKPGEVVVQLPELAESTMATPTPTPTPANIDRWKSLLFN